MNNTIADYQITDYQIEKKIKENISIGLFGFGCVGQGLYDVLQHSQGLKAGISKICVKDRTKSRSLENSFFTYDRNDVLDDDGNNLIVELIDDADAAFEIISSSLINGKDVVTANKKTIAENFELLYKLQLETGSSLLYEGACAGSIPIIRTLEEYYDNELLKSIKGVINGSSNYILTKMELENLSYEQALLEAQALGFAESDPRLDVGGFDSKYKLCLLAAHAFGIIVKPEDILNIGIQNISSFDINYANEKGYRVKLIANGEKICEAALSESEGFHPVNGKYSIYVSSESLTEDSEVLKTSTAETLLKEVRDSAGTSYVSKHRIFVLPYFISKESPLATVNYEFNGIEVEGVYSDKQFFSGKGAGSHPTGSAVLSDISAITYDYKYGYKKLKKRCDFSNDIQFVENDFPIKLYIRYENKTDLRGLKIIDVEEQYSSAKNNYIIANVNFESLKSLPQDNNLFVCAFE